MTNNYIFSIYYNLLFLLVFSGSQIIANDVPVDVDIDRMSLCDFNNDVFTNNSITNGKYHKYIFVIIQLFYSLT